MFPNIQPHCGPLKKRGNFQALVVILFSKNDSDSGNSTHQESCINKDWAENNHQCQIMKPKPTRMDTAC